MDKFSQLSYPISQVIDLEEMFLWVLVHQKNDNHDDHQDDSNGSHKAKDKMTLRFDFAIYRLDMLNNRIQLTSDKVISSDLFMCAISPIIGLSRF